MPVPVWWIVDSLPCIGTGARTTAPPIGLADGLMAEADAQDRHSALAAALISSRQMPASFGVQGPGDSTMPRASRQRLGDASISSLR